MSRQIILLTNLHLRIIFVEVLHATLHLGIAKVSLVLTTDVTFFRIY